MTRRVLRERYSNSVERGFQFVDRLRFADPVQREAMRHIHADLSRLAERRASFRGATAEVRINVIAAIRARSIAKQGSNLGPATSALVAALLAAGALLGSLFIAFLNGYYNWVVKMADVRTGEVSGLTDAQVERFLGQVTSLLFLLAFCVIVVGVLVFLNARQEDSRRGVHTAWLALYEEDHHSLASRVPSRRRRFAEAVVVGSGGVLRGLAAFASAACAGVARGAR